MFNERAFVCPVNPATAAPTRGKKLAASLLRNCASGQARRKSPPPQLLIRQSLVSPLPLPQCRVFALLLIFHLTSSGLGRIAQVALHARASRFHEVAREIPELYCVGRRRPTHRNNESNIESSKNSIHNSSSGSTCVQVRDDAERRLFCELSCYS